jgi:hypothetical protein
MMDDLGAGEAAEGAADGAEAALEAEVLARLSAFRGRLGGELGALFDALAARLRLFEGGPGAGYFSHPMALPVLQLPLWLAARHGEPAAPLVTSLAEAAAAGYLHVRIEDDWFDEAIGEPGAAMLLSGALFARHQALLARELPRASAFWGLFEEVWLGYAEAMLFERRLHKGAGAHDAGAFQRVLARSRPLVLPAAAALFALDRAEALPVLESFVSALSAAHQLFADLVCAEKDRALGNTTHVLFRLGASGDRGPGATGAGASESDRGLAALRAALFVRGGFDDILDEARRELGRAESAAAALALPGATRFLAARGRYMGEIQRKVFLAFFDALQRSAAGGGAPG